MSQITRCPACATSFKVVADQLRISQGWVRCGHCSEVFDASAHLVAPAASALLPDVSLTDVRPQPAPVVRKPVERTWAAGAVPSAASGVQARAAVSNAAPSLPRDERSTASASAADKSIKGVDRPAGQASPVAGRNRAGIDVPRAPAPPIAADAAAPMMEVPEATVPAFLSADSALDGAGLTLEPITPFRWSADGRAAGPVAPGPNLPSPLAGPSAKPGAPAAPVVPGQAERLPALDRTKKRRALDAKAGQPTDPPPALQIPHGERRAEAALPKADSDRATDSQPGARADAPVREPAAEAQAAEGPPAKVPKRSKRSKRDRGDEEALAEPQPEVSFVIAARRKAFWRRPLVRTFLALLLLALLGGLAAQIAVQERDRIAATEPRLRPWLMMLCEPVGCELAPPRQIADLVIDSSSFNKARGDSYLLNMTLRNQASIPLAMPAIELTLTDAQDQPVLRRVLLPTDLGALQEMPARGEWSASVSVVVTTGGGRIAGYRLLTFYP